MKLLASNGEGHHKNKEMFSVPLSEIIEQNQVHTRKRRSSGCDSGILADNKTRKRKASTGESFDEANKGKKTSRKSTKNEDSKSMNVLHRIFGSGSAEKAQQTSENEKLKVCHQLFCLKPQGQKASLTANRRKPILLNDIQSLLLAFLAGEGSPTDIDEWCELKNAELIPQTVFLTINGLSSFHVLCHEHFFAETNEIFKTKLEVNIPKTDRDSFLKKYLLSEVPRSKKGMLLVDHGNLEIVVKEGEGTFLCACSNPEPKDNEQSGPLAEGDKYPRTKLLLSALQMIEDSYPWPYKNSFSGMYDDYIKTKDKYKPVTNRSPLFAIDCEMCKTSASTAELTRVSIVNEDMECVYESLVRPYNEITDYLTQYSGITPEMMLKATKMLPQVQSEIREILPPDAILVGQSLNFDLHAMKMMHPYVIDTSVIYNNSGTRAIKPKLKSLAKYYLKEDIQMNKDGHDSLEDSLAALKLTKLKLSKNVEFGDQASSHNNNLYYNILGYAKKSGRRTAIISTKDISNDFEIFEYNQFRKHNFESPINDKISEGIDYFEIPSNKLATKKIKEIASDFPFIVANLNVEPEKLQVSSVEKTITNIDKWISRVWKSIEPNGLFVVLLTGAKGTSSSVALIKAKEDCRQNLTENPIII